MTKQLEKLEVKTFNPEYRGNYISEVITQNGRVESNCTAITFLNDGETVVTVLDATVKAGASIEFGGDPNCTDETFYPVKFTSEAGKVDKLVVIRQYVTRA